jgi:hypothetical protein
VFQTKIKLIVIFRISRKFRAPLGKFTMADEEPETPKEATEELESSETAAEVAEEEGVSDASAENPAEDESAGIKKHHPGVRWLADLPHSSKSHRERYDRS